MALPRLNVQKYNVVLPLSKEKVEVQPYLAKHERMLLKAKEAKESSEIVSTVIQILQDCTFGYDVMQLPSVDVEFLLLKLKALSSGEIVEVGFRCKNKIDDVVCDHVNPLEIDLENEIELDSEDVKDPKIQLTADIGVMLKPPSFRVFPSALAKESEADQAFEVLADCIAYIWEGDEKISSWTKEEIQEWLDSLSSKHMKLVKDYLDSLPKLKVHKHFQCGKCGYEEDLELSNLLDFFT